MPTSRKSCFLRRLIRGMAAERLAEQADGELVERLLAGPDDVAFEALVHRHGPMVYRVCWRVLRHAEDCEDAFQATFLLLARKLGSLKKRNSLASWLHGVAHRVSLDAKKQACRRRRHEAHVPAPHDGPPDEITWRELRAVLDAELTSLPEKLRLPFILCYLEGRTQEEAARQLGYSKSTLLRRLEEARAALGCRLTRRGVIGPAALVAVLISDSVAQAAPSSKLIAYTVEAAAGILSGAVAAGVVSPKVTALAERVVKAMFMSKMKSVAAVLFISLSGLGLGGLSWQWVAKVHAQDLSQNSNRSATQPSDLEAERKAVERLKEELKRRQARLRQFDQDGTRKQIEQIAAALAKLKELTAADLGRHQAVLQFEPAFQRLKETLNRADEGAQRNERKRGPKATRSSVVNTVVEIRDPSGLSLRAIVSNGNILKVDPEENTVLISRGSKDGVKVGQVYRAYQSGKASSDQTGWLKVTRVEPQWSVARIVQDFAPRAPLQPNDILQLHDEEIDLP